MIILLSTSDAKISSLRVDVTNDKIHKDLMEYVIKPVVPAKYMDDKTIFHLNPSGRYTNSSLFPMSGNICDIRTCCIALTALMLICGIIHAGGPALIW